MSLLLLKNLKVVFLFPYLQCAVLEAWDNFRLRFSKDFSRSWGLLRPALVTLKAGGRTSEFNEGKFGALGLKKRIGNNTSCRYSGGFIS